MPTVLVVDDSLFMRVTIGNMFKEWGFEVIGEAANGKEAVALYDQLKPDLVTMDITMPVMTGIEAVKIIVEKDVEAKVIMVTALGQQKKVKAAIESGAKDFITKPFQEEQLKMVAFNVLNLTYSSQH
ncbi:response regulator [Solibacillus sp. MA9]|uniref:Response regulator n=1 Tax=Solibacillus palustris TaxID=2908203 RepID=A0ABS9UGS5_9BACL|nr:response regulator [Solibacillus sp. MA9]MCH7323443.1 response regulator [Solibacillus sp. MA9]